MATDDYVIRFQAEIIKVQTMIDGALRVTLDLPVTAVEAATKIIQAKQCGAYLEVAAVPMDVTKIQVNQNDGSNSTSGRRKRGRGSGLYSPAQPEA